MRTTIRTTPIRRMRTTIEDDNSDDSIIRMRTTTRTTIRTTPASRPIDTRRQVIRRRNAWLAEGEAADDGTNEEQHRGDLEQPGETCIGQRAGRDQPYAGNRGQGRRPPHRVLHRCGHSAVGRLDGRQIRCSQRCAGQYQPNRQHGHPGQQIAKDVEPVGRRSDEQQSKSGQYRARRQENPGSDPCGVAADALGEQKRHDGCGQGNQARHGRTKTSDFLCVKGDGKRAHAEGPVDERGNEIGAREVADREQLQRHQRIWRAPLPCHECQ